MKNRQPYPFAGAKNLDSYLDGIFEAYSQDVESVGSCVVTFWNVIGDIPETALGAAERVVSASAAFAETGQTVLVVVFKGVGKFASELPEAALWFASGIPEAAGWFVAEIPEAVGRTAFFYHEALETTLQIVGDITIQDVWWWIKAINRIRILFPEFIPNGIRDNNPAQVLQMPVGGAISYNFQNVTDIERWDLPSMMPSTRLYPGNIIDFTPYGIAGYALITCCHTQTAESIQITPDYYQYNENLWDLSDVSEPVPYVSPYSAVSPLLSEIKTGGIQCFWIGYTKRGMIIQDSIRVFKRETKQKNGNEFAQSFVHWEKRLYTPSSVLYTTDFIPSESGSQDTSSYTVEESTIERTYNLMCHGIFLPDRFWSVFKPEKPVFKPEKPVFPFIPLIFAGGLMFFPHATNGVISAVLTALIKIRTNEVKDNE